MDIQPIAYFQSPFHSKFGIPRQSGVVKNLRGKVVFTTEYCANDALRGLEEFDYIWLIWGFSANREQKAFHATVRPPRLGGNERLGVFATRSPYRPNRLGLSSVRISRIGVGVIEVEGADLMDGTPIYDVKPYLPYADAHPDARGGFTDSTKWTRLNVESDVDMSSSFSDDEIQQLKDVLAEDPRPRYKGNDSEEYGMEFMGRDVKFRVSGDTLIIIAITEKE